MDDRRGSKAGLVLGIVVTWQLNPKTSCGSFSRRWHHGTELHSMYEVLLTVLLFVTSTTIPCLTTSCASS